VPVEKEVSGLSSLFSCRRRIGPTEDDKSLLAGIRLLLFNRVTVDVDAVGGEAQHTKSAHICEPPRPAEEASLLLLLGDRIAGYNGRQVSVAPAALLYQGLALLTRSIECVARYRGESSLLDKLPARGGDGESGERLHGH
jgi:hypothetical protein